MDQAHSLYNRLWREPGLKPWVALDGAGVAGLLQRLHHPAAPRWACLFHGRLDPEVAELAPYLLEVPRHGPWCDWLLSGWGVYLQAPETMDLASVRRHLRKLAIAYGPAGESLLFRWYDPRVLRLALPELEAKQLQALFGPLHSFLFEAAAPEHGLELELADGALVMSRF